LALPDTVQLDRRPRETQSPGPVAGLYTSSSPWVEPPRPARPPRSGPTACRIGRTPCRRRRTAHWHRSALGGRSSWLSSPLRGLAAPCLRDDRPELTGGHGGQTHQDGGKPVVVRLGEELLRVQGQQHVLIREACDPDRDDFRLRHARLLGRDALHPHPDEALELALVANREGEVIRRFLRLGQRQRDAADVSLTCHRNHLGCGPRHCRSASITRASSARSPSVGAKAQRKPSVTGTRHTRLRRKTWVAPAGFHCHNPPTVASGNRWPVWRATMTI